MKKILLAIIFLASLKAVAQKASKIDSVFYLIDTTKVPANDRMWDIHEEYPSIKAYVIKCSCLQYNTEPMFIFNMKREEGKVITSKGLKSIKLINIKDLIDKAKQFTDSNYKGNYAVFLIEPNKLEYKMHQVRLLRPSKPQIVN